MKKTLFIMLSALCLTACSSSANNSADSQQERAEQDSAEKLLIKGSPYIYRIYNDVLGVITFQQGTFKYVFYEHDDRPWDIMGTIYGNWEMNKINDYLINIVLTYDLNTLTAIDDDLHLLFEAENELDKQYIDNDEIYGIGTGFWNSDGDFVRNDGNIVLYSIARDKIWYNQQRAKLLDF